MPPGRVIHMSFPQSDPVFHRVIRKRGSYPQERELSSTFVSKTAAKCGKLRNLAVYRLVYVWISLWIMWKTLLTVSENPANIPNFARF